MKATGQGLTYGLTSFAVTLAAGDRPELLWLAEGDPQCCGLADVAPDAEHIGAVCAEGRDWQPRYLVAPEAR